MSKTKTMSIVLAEYSAETMKQCSKCSVGQEIDQFMTTFKKVSRSVIPWY